MVTTNLNNKIDQGNMRLEAYPCQYEEQNSSIKIELQNRHKKHFRMQIRRSKLQFISTSE